MALPSLAEAVTASFYAWELRGRGWQLAEYPVSLEPPYRPFFLLPELLPPPAPRDDGRRPTLLGSLVEGTRRLFGHEERAEPKAAITPYEEQAPFPGARSNPITALRILVPADYASDPDVTGELLLALGATLEPVSVELVGAAGQVAMQIVCSTEDAEQVRDRVEGFIPDASVLDAEDALVAAWDSHATRLAIDFALSNEFFLPLKSLSSFSIDPYVLLVAALARARAGEFLMLQVLFERVRNPWANAVRQALDDGEGGCFFEDAPEFLPAAKEKGRAPLFAVTLRIGAQARSVERVWELARSVHAFVLQFARPGGNELVPLENDGYPDNVHTASLLARESFRTGMLLSSEELAGFVHLPDRSVRQSALSREVRRTKGVPPGATGHPFILGDNLHRGERCAVSLSTEERLQHVHVIGASGTGKSTLLVNMIGQDIAAGTGVAVLDPHGDLIDDVIARIPEERIADVVLFDPADEEWPIGFNILGAKSERERNLLASDLVGIFERLSTSWGDTMSTVLGNAVLAMLERREGGTLLDLRRFLIDEGFRKAFLATVPDEDVRFFWEREYPVIGTRAVGPLLTRLDTLLRPKLVRAIVGQHKARLDLARVMVEGKVFLAKLSQGMIGEENAALLGSLLVSKFHQLALGRQALPKSERRPFFLYADECQHFVTPSMGALVTEGRKYGLGLTLAHQGLAQLEHAGPVKNAILGGHTRIVFRVADDDAMALAQGFAFFEADDLKRLGRGEAIVRIGSADHDCNLRTRPAVAVADGVAEGQALRVVEGSRECYAVPLAELRQAWSERYGKKDEPSPPPVPAPEVPQPVQVAKGQPIASPEPVRPRAPTRRPIPVPEPAPMGRGGREHKYLQYLLKRLGEERGFRALIEEAAGDGRADVVLKKDELSIACEVSITTDVEHEIENLKKCLGAGFTRILFVSPDKKRRQKVAKWVKEEGPSVPIDVIDPEEIVGVLDALTVPQQAAETTVRGYKVKVTRQALSPEDMAGRRSAVAQVIARSMQKHKPEEPDAPR